MSRVSVEPLEAILARRQLSHDDWRIAVDERLRRRDYERASAERLRRVAAEMAARQPQQEDEA
jgi:hypothetical protein